MGLLENLGKWINIKGKPTLKQLSLDILRREQATVEMELGKLHREAERIENDEAKLKEEYKAAHAANRLSVKRIVAQKLRNSQMKRRGLETRLSHTNRMFQAVTGLITIKENMHFFENLGVGSVLAQMDVAELEGFVLDATIEGTLRQDKLAATLRRITEGADAINDSGGDSDVDDFMDELDAELLGESRSPSVTGASEQLDDILRDIDSVAEKGVEVSRKIQRTNRPDEEQVK